LTQKHVVWVIIGIHALALMYSSWVHSPTQLEANSLAAGYLHVKHGRFDCAQVNPPFSRILISLPLLGFDIVEDWRSLSDEPQRRPEYAVGTEFVERNLPNARRLFFACRLVAIAFSVVGAAAIYLFSKEYFGERAALVSVAMWCFCPLVLGHGATVCHDMPGASMLMVALLIISRLRQEFGVSAILRCGIAAGLAILTRTTNLIVLAIWMSAIGITWVYVDKSRKVFGTLASLSLFTLVTVFTINACYGFSGTGIRLGSYEFHSRAFTGQTKADTGNRFQGTCLARVPVPLPKDFLVGVDIQQLDFERPWFRSYLCGEWNERGWPYFYLIAWCVKTPVGFLLATLFSLMVSCWKVIRRRSTLEEVCILLSIAGVLGVLCIKHGFTTHYRYIFTAIPLIAVLNGAAFSTCRWKVTKAAMVLALLGGAAESASVYPYSMSFFNRAVGGPASGWRYLLHSNLDSGQDLYEAAEFCRQSQAEGRELFVKSLGVVDLRQLGVNAREIPARRNERCQAPGEIEVSPGIYLVSVSHLHEEEGRYRYLTKCPLVGRIGYSIELHHVREQDIAAQGLNSLCPE